MNHNYDNLDSRQLSDILHLLQEECEGENQSDMAAHTEFMNDCMNRPFVAGRFQDMTFSGIPEMLHKSFIFSSQHLLSDLFYDKKTPLIEFKRAKSFFGVASKKEQDAVKKDVYIALYYAFIAIALIHCNKKITEHSTSDLHGYFEKLMKKSWISESILEIYRQACDYLIEISSMDTKS